MKRESMVFYDSFFEAIKDLPPEEFKKCACGLLCYGLYGEAPESSGIEKTIYVLSKPLIDKNNQRWENSKKRTVRTAKNDVEEETEKTVAEVKNAETVIMKETSAVDECFDDEVFPEAESPKQADSFKDTSVSEERAEDSHTRITERVSPTVNDGTNMVFLEGTYKNVRLNVAEKCRILNEIGFIKYADCVKYLSEYLHNNPTLDSGDHMEDILGWVLQKVDGISLSG